MDVARNWAVKVNGCELAEEGDSDSVGRDEMGEEEGKEVKGGDQENEKRAADAKNEEEPESTGTKNNKGEDDNKEEDAILVSSIIGETMSGPRFVASYVDGSRGVKCLTATGTDCKANATICLHENSGHFNNPSFGEAFPFAREVFDFFAKDACAINDGTWDGTRNMCSCPVDRGGMFCLDKPVVALSIASTPVIPGDENDISNIESGVASSTRKVGISLLFFALGISYAVRHRHRKVRKKDDITFQQCDEESTELISSEVFHRN